MSPPAFRLVLLCLALCPSLWAGDPFAGKTRGRIGIVKTLKTYQAAVSGDLEATTVVALTRDQAGAVYLLDGPSGFIFAWDADGALVNAFGGNGQGPGELKDSLLIAADADHVYVSQIGQQTVVFNRGPDGRFSNKHARHLPYTGPPARLYRPVTTPTGETKLFIAGQHNPEDPEKAYFHHLKDGNLTEIKAVEAPVEHPDYNALNMMDPKQPLIVGFPRAWAVQGPDQTLIYGFSNTNTLYAVSPTGAVKEWLKFKLPPQIPSERDMTCFMNTPVVVLEKTIIDFEHMLQAKFNIQSKEPMSAYSQFVLLDEHRILFLLSPFAGFQLANYLNEAVCLIYDTQKGETTARGRLQLPLDQRLFPMDNRFLLTEYNDDDQLVVREVQLGWLD